MVIYHSLLVYHSLGFVFTLYGSMNLFFSDRLKDGEIELFHKHGVPQKRDLEDGIPSTLW